MLHCCFQEFEHKCTISTSHQDPNHWTTNLDGVFLSFMHVILLGHLQNWDYIMLQCIFLVIASYGAFPNSLKIWCEIRVSLASHQFSQLCHNFVTWWLVSGEIMDSHGPTILFPPLTTCHILKLWKLMWC